MNRHGQKAPEFVKRDEGSFVGLAEPEEIDKKGGTFQIVGEQLFFHQFDLEKVNRASR